MLLSWFDASEAKAFGLSMADVWIERMPLAENLNEKQYAAKSKKIFDIMLLRISGFKMKQKKKLNIYKTAQLGNAFKWALKDAGYEDRYVSQLTEWLVSRLQ
jgi:hypothetical protein